MFRFFERFARGRSPRDLALAALSRGAYAEAEERLGALLADAGTDAERAFILNKRGVARMGIGRQDDARADFTSALECVARYAPALANLGNLRLEEGDLDGAIVQYEAAIRADADYAVAHFNLGVAYKRAGRLDEGVRAMRTAQRLEGRMLGKPTKRA